MSKASSPAWRLLTSDPENASTTLPFFDQQTKRLQPKIVVSRVTADSKSHFVAHMLCGYEKTPRLSSDLSNSPFDAYEDLFNLSADLVAHMLEELTKVGRTVIGPSQEPDTSKPDWTVLDTKELEPVSER